MDKVEYLVKKFESKETWEEWLRAEHESRLGVWLQFAKKNSGDKTVTFPEALEVALCYGWIDGQSKSLNEKYYLQKFTPRGKKSTWSKINRDKVERLISDGKMQPAGLRVIEAAKSDGRWELAYDPPSKMEIPNDFLIRLAQDQKAESFYNSLNKSNKYEIGWRLQTAKKAGTREKRMQVILEMLHEGKKFH